MSCPHAATITQQRVVQKILSPATTGALAGLDLGRCPHCRWLAPPGQHCVNPQCARNKQRALPSPWRWGGETPG